MCALSRLHLDYTVDCAIPTNINRYSTCIRKNNPVEFTNRARLFLSSLRSNLFERETPRARAREREREREKNFVANDPAAQIWR